MRIHPLSTGTVRVTTAFERGSGPVPLRQLRAIRDRHYTDPLPIHAWLVEHPDGPLLVDTGELADVRDMPWARFSVTPQDEIDRLLSGVGVAPKDLKAIVFTHLHLDHRDGLARLPKVPALVGETELRRSPLGRRALRGRATTTIRLRHEPFGAFPTSAPLTGDGTIRAVPIPGHTLGQLAIVIDEGDRHVMLAGDSAYSQAQLLERHPDGIGARPATARETMERILAHARRHPTVYLPSHDPESATRLANRATVPVDQAQEPVTA